jgi:hypothetical protein
MRKESINFIFIQVVMQAVLKTALIYFASFLFWFCLSNYKLE